MALFAAARGVIMFIYFIVVEHLWYSCSLFMEDDGALVISTSGSLDSLIKSIHFFGFIWRERFSARDRCFADLQHRPLIRLFFTLYNPPRVNFVKPSVRTRGCVYLEFLLVLFMHIVMQQLLLSKEFSRDLKLSHQMAAA
jgi:hypothetical protein